MNIKFIRYLKKQNKSILLKNRKLLITILILFQLLALSLFSGTYAATDLPHGILIFFSTSLKVGQTGAGTIFFRDIPVGVSKVQFNVVDGRYDQINIETFIAGPSGQIPFTLECTTFSQAITLQVQLIDNNGQVHAPELLRFTCGIPINYNFSQEIKKVFPILDRIKIHFFILEDQITTLSDGASNLDRKILKNPSEEVERVIRTEITSTLSSIWDQCSIGFKAGEVRVIDPYQLQLSIGNFGELLFSKQDNIRKIVVEENTHEILEYAVKEITLALKKEGTLLNHKDLVVFFVGSQILFEQNKTMQKIEGFGSTGPYFHYVFARWGTIHQVNNTLVVPKQMLATVAHEFGHNFGLKHPDENSPLDIKNDQNNLMKGSGVTPEPRANLITSQCEAIRID